MAPKIKKLASKGKGASSSSRGGDDPYDRDLFLDAQCYTRYQSLQNVNLCLGREVKFQDFISYNLQAFLERQGWSHLFVDVENIYPRLVRLFFAHLNVSTEANVRQLTSFVKGKNIVLDPSILASIFNIPDNGEDIFGDDILSFSFPAGSDAYTASALIRRTPNRAFVKDTRIKILNADAYILAKLIFDSIYPKGGDTDHIRGCTPLLIYCLMSYTRVNLPMFMYDCIVDADHTQRNLPYGSFFTNIFKYFDVDLSGEVYLSPISPFNKRVISGMLKVINDPIPGSVRQQGAAEEEEEAEEESEEEGEYGDFGSRLSHLETRFEEHSSYVQEEFQNIHGKLDSMDDKLDSIMSALHIGRKKRR